jgi:hypothetical protein
MGVWASKTFGGKGRDPETRPTKGSKLDPEAVDSNELGADPEEDFKSEVTERTLIR